MLNKQILCHINGTNWLAWSCECIWSSTFLWQLSHIWMRTKNAQKTIKHWPEHLRAHWISQYFECHTQVMNRATIKWVTAKNEFKSLTTVYDMKNNQKPVCENLTAIWISQWILFEAFLCVYDRVKFDRRQETHFKRIFLLIFLWVRYAGWEQNLHLKIPNVFNGWGN